MKNLRQMLRRASWLNFRQRSTRPGSPPSESKRRRLSTQALERRELLAGDIAIAHNGWNSLDVNDDREVTALDALIGMNRLAQQGEGEVSIVSNEKLFLDVNNDGEHTASDSLRVINALARGEGQSEHLIELLVSARDLNDQLITPDANGDINVGVGSDTDRSNDLFVEVSYTDLRGFDATGAFKLIVDLTSSNSSLRPVLNETQRIIFSEEIRSADSGTILFESTDRDTGADVSYTSNFGAWITPGAPGPEAEIGTALEAFGYTSDQFRVSRLDFGDQRLAYQILYTDTDEFGNDNLPNITVTPNLGDDGVPINVTTEFEEFAPFNLDGTVNTQAIRFNLDTNSRTFKDNQPFYNSLIQGAFDEATGLDEWGGTGGVPTGGGGIPELLQGDPYVQPFDAFSYRVFFDRAASDVKVDVNPGEDVEATLLYGRDEVVPQDLVLIQELTEPREFGAPVGAVDFNGDDAVLNFNVGSPTNTPPTVDGAVTAEFDEDDDESTVDLLAGAEDLDGDLLSVTTPQLRSGDDSGIVSINDNIVTVDPSAYSALNTGDPPAVIIYDYFVTDGTDQVAQTATITITGITDNTPPTVSGPVTATFTEDDGSTFVDLLANALDAEGDTLSALDIQVQAGDDARGITIDAANNRLNVNPTAYGFLNTGDPPVVVDYTYTVSDGINTPVAASAQITITGITDGGTNSPPQLGTSPLTATVTEDTGVQVLDLLDDASDPDVGDTLSALNLQRESGTGLGITQNGNQLRVNTNAYELALGDPPQQSVYSYQVSDGIAQVNQTITITVNGVNDPPTVSDPVSQSFNSDAAAGTVDLLANASDVDGGTLDATNIVNTDGDTSGITVNDAGNSLTVDPAAYSLAVDEEEIIIYTYTVDDGNGGTVDTSVTVTITGVGVNNPPELSISPLTETFNEDQLGTFDVNLLQGATDADPGDTLNAINLTRVSGDDSGISVSPSGNSLNVTPSAYNSLRFDQSEPVVYTYDVSDGEASVDQTVTVTITGRNDAPTVSSSIIDEYDDSDLPTSISLLQFASDPDVGDMLNVSDPQVISGDNSGVMVVGNRLDIDPSAYDVPPGDSTTVVIGFDLIDGNGGSVEQTATITINGEPIGVTMTGLIYIDELDDGGDRNGIMDFDEYGVGGVSVHLRPLAGGSTRTTLTDAEGDYSFDGVEAGTYEVEYDLPSNAVVVGSTVSTVTVNGTDPPADILRVLGFTGTLGNIDIIASTYLNGGAVPGGDGEIEGAKFGLDGDAQDLFVLLEGFDGYLFAEFDLNAELDAALLSLVDGEGVVHTAVIGEDDFVLSPDGRAAVLLGGMSKFDFSESVDSVLADFPGFGDATQQYLNDRD